MMITEKQRRKGQKIRFPNSHLIFCPICYWSYLPRVDGSAHSRYHRKMMRIINAVPDKRLSTLPCADICVQPASLRWLHSLVYERARALRREEGYDFTQWLEDQAPNPNCQAWLFVEPDCRPIGVAGFEWMDWNNIRHGWHLNFVWIAPPYRRKGILSERWPKLVQKYGWFTIEEHLSPAMKAFLFKVHHRTDLYACLHPKPTQN
jgi:hypothetical protein